MFKIIELLYGKKKEIKRFIPKYLYWKKRLFKPFDSKRVFIIGCPEYSNLGDNAILLAMISFLKDYAGIDENNIECLTEHEFLGDHDVICRFIGKKNLLCGLGGGNMGNRYRSEEVIRRTMLELFPKNPIIIFPQTISYEGASKEEDEQLSVKYYNGRVNLTIVAREEYSKTKMESLYPDTKIMLTPDIVLSSSVKDYGVSAKQRKGILFCTRTDGEKAVDDSVWDALRNDVCSLGCSYINTDMYSDIQIRIDTRKDCVMRKMEEFCRSELAITDRLHAMIFAAITGTPCIVFSNNNHKVRGTYEWISYLSYIRYVNTYEEAVDVLPDLLRMGQCEFDNSPLLPYFNELVQEVLSKTN